MSDLIDEFISLTKKRRRLEAELAPVTDRLKALQPRLLDHFERTGDQRVARNRMTVYLRRETWAIRTRDVDQQDANAALKAAGLDDFVKENFSPQSLSAYARELETDGRDFFAEHPELRGKITLDERYDVRAIST